MVKEKYKQYFKILEVDDDASFAEIERAYLHLKKLYSTGSLITLPIAEEFSDEEKQQILEQVEDAYQNLTRSMQEEVKESEERISEADTLPEQIVSSPSEGPGQAMKEMREKMGKSLQTVSEAVDIPVDILGHIESETFEELPDAAGYLRWYVMTYARHLTLDPRQTADDYMSLFRQWKTRT